MQYEFLKYPKSIRAMAVEIRRVTNDYDARKIGNEELKEIILWYAIKCSNKLFRGEDFNPTLTQIIGRRRIKLIDELLDGYQLKLFEGVK